MAKKNKRKIIFTVDVEPDWGWRTLGTQGIDEGLPKILQLFDDYNVKGIFFFSPNIGNAVIQASKGFDVTKHKIGEHIKGKHGCSGIVYGTCGWQKSVYISNYKYARGHKFEKFDGWKKYIPYSSPENHTSLLKHMWVGQPVRDIIYLHPFDIVKPKTKAPNLFCKLWYSQPERAWKTLEKLVRRYNG